jgi:hypothetical protein
LGHFRPLRHSPRWDSRRRPGWPSAKRCWLWLC